MKMLTVSRAFLLIISGCMAGTAAGQNYEVTGQAVISGSGRASSESFTVTSTVGDAIVGAATSEAYRVHGGVLAVRILSPTGISRSPVVLPEKFLLLQNYPNPFNPATTIVFGVPSEEQVTIAIYDITGRETARLYDDMLSAGFHSVIWDGTNRAGEAVGSGIYYAVMAAGEHRAAIKILLLK